MKPEKLVQHLTDAIKKIGYKVRTEEGSFRGGSCVFAEEHLVILNRRMTQEERAEVLARALASESLETIFLLPEVRAYIEKFGHAQDADPAPPVADGQNPSAETETPATDNGGEPS